VPLVDFVINTFATLLVTIDPIGLAPIFLAVTRDASPVARRSVAWRASLIAAIVLEAFAFVGAGILNFLGISMPAFRIAGGLLLFWIAFEMVFEKREQRKSASAKQMLHADQGDVELLESATMSAADIRNLAAFPLAIPLIAGPGAISATILLASQARLTMTMVALVAMIIVMIGICYAIFIAADRVDRYLGDTGRSVLTRLLGVLLAALSVQFVADGVKAIMS
jgi:multiple antibiotic resistance protein